MLALMLCASALPASAQDAILAPSPALACLTREAGAPALPDYPPNALERKEGGILRVQLEFKGPDQPPRINIVDRPVMGNFDSAVRDYVARYRVPCMAAGEAPVRLTQEYVFDPDQQSRVVASRPRDDADPERARQLKCMAHQDGLARPDFPKEALHRGESGTLIMRLRFTSAGAPPTVEAVQSVPSPSLRRAVARHLEGFRMPCLQSHSVETLIAFKYLFDNGPVLVLRDSSLVEALGAARDLKTPAHFDFNAMACPFELRVSYHQPFSANRVQQLDSARPEREPFMQWLEGLTLNVNGATAANAFGSKFVIAVPCGKLDL